MSAILKMLAQRIGLGLLTLFVVSVIIFLGVSMLPGDWHVPLAELCLEKGAHFVSSSYIAPEMRALDDAAREKGLRFVNEIGLDPGIDHLMAHALVDDYLAWQAPLSRVFQ